MDEVITDFLVESYENLDQLDEDLVSLEDNPTTESLAGIFRTIHTIKGATGFLGFSKLEAVAHVGESLLSKVRDGHLEVTSEITTALLSLVDAVRQLLGEIENTGEEGDGDFAELKATLTRLQTQGSVAEIETTAQPVPTDTPEPPPIAVTSTEVVSNPHSDTGAPVAPIAPEQCAAPAAGVKRGSTTVALPPADQGKQGPRVSNANVRVDVTLLDKLMNLVGELVLARNQILQYATNLDDLGFIATTQRLNLLTSELQEGVMKTRMQPIRNLWSKFPRVVRDLALQCGKRVRIEMEGEGTELDRTLIEAIKDPMTHIVRNSIDHGIEPPDVRAARGKPELGTLYLRAYHEGGQVNIEISDDGGGIDVDKVKSRAIDRGLITSDRAAQLTNREAYELLFTAGFSTADKINNVSGRGVGMDVVRTNIEKIGGTIDIQSKFGYGTTLKVKIPLTLAIIPALIVQNGDRWFAIPQVSLIELVRLEGQAGNRQIENLHGAPVYRLRGNLLPLVYLHQTLETNSQATDDIINIVVLQGDNRQFGLVVDCILDTEEIVVKPLGKQLKGLTVFAGATIMGDGNVALILDVLGIAARSQVVSADRGDRTHFGLGSAADVAENTNRALLLVRGADRNQVGVPLSNVDRLEEFRFVDMEAVGTTQVVQYRNDILPLIPLSSVLSSHRMSSDDDKDKMQVIVCTLNDATIGLVVDQIVDIVEAPISSARRGSKRGVAAVSVVDGKVTEWLDVNAVFASSDVSFDLNASALGALGGLQ